MLVPFFVVASVVSGSIIAILIRKRLSGLVTLKWKRFLYDRCVPLLILFCVTMYSFLVNTAVSPFKCTYTSGYAMYENPSQICFDSEWLSHLPEITFFLILYAIGMPGILIYLFYANRDRSHTDEFRSSFGSMTLPYHDEWFWWELTQVFRRTCFAILNAFLKMLTTEDSAVFFTSCLLCTFLILEVAVKPHRKHLMLLASITYETLFSRFI
jgi:hypothetical protein